MSEQKVVIYTPVEDFLYNQGGALILSFMLLCAVLFGFATQHCFKWWNNRKPGGNPFRLTDMQTNFVALSVIIGSAVGFWISTYF